MNILHMTDLHFSRDTEENEIREKWNHIKIKLKEELGDKKVDAMAVTGDITCHGDLCEFRQAKSYLLELAGLLYVKREKIFFAREIMMRTRRAKALPFIIISHF